MRVFGNCLNTLKNSPMSNELSVILKGSAVMSVASFLITLIWGFELSMLIGMIIGYVYLVFCYCYLALTVCRATTLKDKKAAKRKMFSCYAVRLGGLFILCWIGYMVSFINPIGVLLPQFFPRIALMINHFFFSKRGNSNGRT